MRPWIIPLTTLLMVMLFQANAHAGRVITFDILLDNQVILMVAELDNGSRSPDEVWKDLASCSLQNPAKKFVLNPAERERLNTFEKNLETMARGNRLILKGKIRIFCRYAGDATTDSLTLIRKDAKSPGPSIPPRSNASPPLARSIPPAAPVNRSTAKPGKSLPALPDAPYPAPADQICPPTPLP